MSETNEQDNPYLDGRREWNERYGSYINQAKNWRIFSMGSLFIAAMSVIGMIYIGSQPKVKPYIVEVDKLGQIMQTGPMPEMKFDEKVVKFGLADFITNFRSIYIHDPNIQKKMVYDAYKYISNEFPAKNQVDEFFIKNSPFTQTNNRQVEITSVLPLGGSTYQVDWKEKILDKGLTIEENGYRATINIVVVPPKTDVEIIKNPIGLFIRDISFQKTLN